VNFLSCEPLTDAELEYLDKILLKFGNDHSVLNVSELDGFLTAIVSGPQAIMPSQWFPALWCKIGDTREDLEWESEQECQRFMSLLMQHMNSIAATLMEAPEEFEALLQVNTQAEPPVLIAEEWCFGYMRGVDLGQWPPLPDEMDTWLYAIALHGREENFSVLDTLTLEEHQQTVADIEPAVRKLHAYWLAQRTPTRQAPLRAEPKVGRNDPCPCGSGKKFKHCCLH